jgi:hypothetical protein
LKREGQRVFAQGEIRCHSRFTVVKDLKKELGAGLLSDMLKQLGIRKEDS